MHTFWDKDTVVESESRRASDDGMTARGPAGWNVGPLKEYLSVWHALVSAPTQASNNPEHPKFILKSPQSFEPVLLKDARAWLCMISKG